MPTVDEWRSIFETARESASETLALVDTLNRDVLGQAARLKAANDALERTRAKCLSMETMLRELAAQATGRAWETETAAECVDAISRVLTAPGHAGGGVKASDLAVSVDGLRVEGVRDGNGVTVATGVFADAGRWREVSLAVARLRRRGPTSAELFASDPRPWTLIADCWHDSDGLRVCRGRDLSREAVDWVNALEWSDEHGEWRSPGATADAKALPDPERPPKAMALLLARVLTWDTLDNLAREFGAVRARETDCNDCEAVQGDDEFRPRVIAAIEASK